MKTSKHTIAGLGWIPDLPDQRDFQYSVPKGMLRQLPDKVDLRTLCPPVYDQGQLGSCTGQAIAGAIQYGLNKQDATYGFMPSALFIYYNERVIENTVDCDCGAYLRDGIKTANKDGVCAEPLWPYSDGPVAFKTKPTPKCYTEAQNHQILTYERIGHDLQQMKGCLAEGYPFIFGFAVYDSFMSGQTAQTGIAQLPKSDETLVGGHAVLCVGYDDKSGRFIVRNSWGANWGQGGYFTMPYSYLLRSDLADDFWTIRMIELNPALLQAKKPSAK